MSGNTDRSQTIADYLKAIPAENTATRVSFFLAGFLMALWAAMVPFVKTQLQLDEAHLGMLLLMLGLGALVVMPFCGGIIAKRGVKFLLKPAYYIVPVLLCAVVFSERALLSAVFLFVFGMVFGAIDVSMNVHAVDVDAKSPKRLIAGFHALYSFGSVIGALAMTLLLNIGVFYFWALVSLLLFCLVVWFLTAEHLLTNAGKDASGSGKVFVIPSGFVLYLGLISFLLFMVEGAVLDWGAVFLVEIKAGAVENAGLAFAAFSTAMTMMRLIGDKAIAKFGPRQCVRFGTLLAALSLAACVYAPGVGSSVTCFLLLGIGLANIIPICFASTAHQTIMPMSLALSAVTTLGYAGLLTGPALIGFVARWTSLGTAFLMLAVFLLAVSAAAGIFRTKS